MREFLENKVEVTQAEARALVERCLKVLYYRDARSHNRVRDAPPLRGSVIGPPSLSSKETVAQEAEQVGWSPEGCWFDPRLLLAECGDVPERDASHCS